MKTDAVHHRDEIFVLIRHQTRRGVAELPLKAESREPSLLKNFHSSELCWKNHAVPELEEEKTSGASPDMWGISGYHTEAIFNNGR